MEADTIAAIVTPPGEGGVGIVRTSGPLSTTLPGRLFPRLGGAWNSHHMRQGTIVDPRDGRVVDQALACLMCAPRSYTGEDVCEVQCHGNPLILERVLELCLLQGCRPARPGEFTLRAFLNGRLDLPQAEAVLDVVRARSNAGLDLAMQQLAGWLTVRVEPLRQDLLGILAHMEAMVDFVEDDVPGQIDGATVCRLHDVRTTLGVLIQGAEQGAILREGATLAIVGAPNVGKSSLMNALLGLERSIVTHVAGTTRDTVEEMLEVRGIPFRTIDTAGITETDDVVERIGVERSRQSLTGADIILLVLDRSRQLQPDDELAIQAVHQAVTGDDEQARTRRLLVALNKSDLQEVSDVRAAAVQLLPRDVIDTSAIEITGVDALRTGLERAALGNNRQEWVGGNARHKHALERAVSSLDAAVGGLRTGVPLDLLSLDVREAVQTLGGITGAAVDDELLDRIFRDFCIGK